jgi:hypothetical protein
MTSRRRLAIVGIVIWSAVALTASPRVMPQHGTRFTVSSSDELANRCSDLHVRLDHREALLQSEQRTISKAEAPTLRVTAESNGGVQVQGWENDAYSVTLCKAAEEGSDAESILSQIHLSFKNGELGITGPSSHSHWSAHLLIRSPKAAVLDVSMNNGPLSLQKVDGQIKIRSENGPVTVRECSGALDLSSQNGPLTLDGNRGRQSVHTHNGPVTLSLSGDAWVGDGLEAQAMNGPITLEIPSGYRSGVMLETEGHSAFECASVCSEGRRTWDDDHKRIEFGSGPTLVRVSTINGPVSVN